MTYRTKSGHQSASDPLEFVLSDESVDRVGDQILAAGWKLEAFKAAGAPALFGHDGSRAESIVGRWTRVRVEGSRLLGVLELAKAGTSAVVDTVRALIEQRLLNACSVGFLPLASEPRRDGPGRIYKAAELLECSLTPIPANPRALLIAKSLGMGEPALRRLFGPPSHARALDRAREAVAKADAALGRNAPRGELSAAQRRVVDRLPACDLLASVGSVLGRELASRDARIRALEARALASDPRAVQARARAAVRRAAEALR
ncbi:HK97 family phage prohead protease [Variovorax sp. J22R24]|uniref:HK97 family phage prohead protease n=1 Tax=Variovorax gracilis TaxID=3053502 RepID=UPI0025782A08|nr:HK97 family phage prohead protease [Variovorax sp. J22R24]MDM0107802.1 HK97 family phage prohead protease [Variovorax sp. J22R24]